MAPDLRGGSLRDRRACPTPGASRRPARAALESGRFLPPRRCGGQASSGSSGHGSISRYRRKSADRREDTGRSGNPCRRSAVRTARPRGAGRSIPCRRARRGSAGGSRASRDCRGPDRQHRAGDWVLPLAAAREDDRGGLVLGGGRRKRRGLPARPLLPPAIPASRLAPAAAVHAYDPQASTCTVRAPPVAAVATVRTTGVFTGAAQLAKVNAGLDKLPSTFQPSTRTPFARTFRMAAVTPPPAVAARSAASS